MRLVLPALVALIATACSVAHTTAPEHAGTHHPLVVAVGDSITAGNPGWDADATTRGQLARLGFELDFRSSWVWWAQQRHPGLDFRNCGVGGDTTAMMLTRFEGCLEGADAVVIQGGLNDLEHGETPHTAAATIERMVEQAARRRLVVLVATVTPPYGRYAHLAPSIDRLNGLLESVAERHDVLLLDFHDVLADPARPSLMRRSLQRDGIHPNVAGYRILGTRGFPDDDALPAPLGR